MNNKDTKKNPINQKNSFENKKEVKKGDIGEQIIKNILKKKGYAIYTPEEGAHLTDMIITKNHKEIKCIEIKSYARMNKWNATGIDINDYITYSNIWKNYGIEVIIFWLDDHPTEERIYCAKISDLMAEYKSNGVSYPNQKIAPNKVLFSLDKMKEVRKLTKEELIQLKENNNRTYDYK